METGKRVIIRDWHDGDHWRLTRGLSISLETGMMVIVGDLQEGDHWRLTGGGSLETGKRMIIWDS